MSSESGFLLPALLSVLRGVATSLPALSLTLMEVEGGACYLTDGRVSVRALPPPGLRAAVLADFGAPELSLSGLRVACQAWHSVACHRGRAGSCAHSHLTLQPDGPSPGPGRRGIMIPDSDQAGRLSGATSS